MNSQREMMLDNTNMMLIGMKNILAPLIDPSQNYIPKSFAPSSSFKQNCTPNFNAGQSTSNYSYPVARTSKNWNISHSSGRTPS